MKHAIDYLQRKGVETIGLYAYPNLVNFYGNLGFKAEADFVVLHAQSLNLSPKEKLSKVGNLPRINSKSVKLKSLMANALAEIEQKLLESIILEEGNLGYYSSAGNEVDGYVAATVYADNGLGWTLNMPRGQR